jgi:S-(hydroxymethyl)glutathione dehydrogenase/alcohol dehydrogenase
VTADNGAPLVAGSGIGGLAEYALIDERGLVTVPDAMPLVPAALLGCAVLTGTGAVFRSARVTPAASVAVIGCGGVGLSIIQAARISGAHPIVAVDRAPKKLEVAVALGATHTVLSVAGSGEHLEQIRSITHGLGVDFSFEAVGSAATAEDAVSILARRGTATIVGVFPAGIEIKVPARDMLTRETRLQGSYMGSSVFRRDIPQLCQMYLAGTLHLDQMIDPQIKLDDVRHGFELLAAGAAVRPVVVLDVDVQRPEAIL